MVVAPSPAYDEVLEFLVMQPTPEAIIAFRPSEATQQHVRDLLAANRDGTLTDDQRRELDEFERIEHLVRMLKIKAHEKLTE